MLCFNFLVHTYFAQGPGPGNLEKLCSRQECAKCRVVRCAQLIRLAVSFFRLGIHSFSIVYIYFQWRRCAFWGRTPRPLKGYHTPPAGGPGGCSLRMVTRLKILKLLKIRKNEPILHKYQHFSCPNHPSGMKN